MIENINEYDTMMLNMYSAGKGIGALPKLVMPINASRGEVKACGILMPDLSVLLFYSKGPAVCDGGRCEQRLWGLVGVSLLPQLGDYQ